MAMQCLHHRRRCSASFGHRCRRAPAAHRQHAARRQKLKPSASPAHHLWSAGRVITRSSPRRASRPCTARQSIQPKVSLQSIKARPARACAKSPCCAHITLPQQGFLIHCRPFPAAHYLSAQRVARSAGPRIDPDSACIPTREMSPARSTFPAIAAQSPETERGSRVRFSARGAGLSSRRIFAVPRPMRPLTKVVACSCIGWPPTCRPTAGAPGDGCSSACGRRAVVDHTTVCR